MSDSSSSGDDVPLSSLGGSKRKSRGSVNYNEDDSDESEAEFQDEEASAPDGDDDGCGGMDTDDFIDDDSSEDGKPLSALKSPKKASSAKKKTPAKKTKATSPKKRAPKKKETSVKKKKASLTKSKSTVSTTSSKPSSSYNAPSIELYAKCDKGKLIQSVLVRWWYAYTWPDPENLPKSTPKNYTALDGFPGVYICTSGSDVGKFKDYRDLNTAPSFKNFARKEAQELKEMLLRAIENQRKALIKMEGEGTGTEKELRELEKWANKLNCGNADKEAEKVLKAARLVLS